MITLGALDELDGIRHGFFTREGGVSEGCYASLNCGYGSGDRPEHVDENRARAAARLGLAPDRLVTVYQVHGTTVAPVGTPWSRDAAPRADALVTATPGIALGILTADCAPVLFADPLARVVAAAHAGWKGAFTGVAEATLAAMVEHGARPGRVVAAIGPCIAQPSYEVGPEFRERFVAEDPANAAFFVPSPRPGHARFDLPGYLERRLARAGVRTVLRAAGDTAADDARFFSYRRTVLDGGGAYGRGLSAIAIGD